MNVVRFLVALLMSILAFSSALCKADWINLTGAETAPNIAEIYIHDDHVQLNLEIFVNDLEIFKELIPDNFFEDTNIQRPNISKRLNEFSENKFQFITETGENLQAELSIVEPRLRKDRKSPFAGMINPVTQQRAPEAPADKRVLYAELKFPFDKKPNQLTIVPPLDNEGRVLASIGFIVYQKSVPIIDFRYLSEDAKLTLNWSDPWYSKFENPNLKRHHKDALMSFLYVEPFEVRHELLIRVKDMQNWINFKLQGTEYIEINELESVKKQIGEFLLTKNKVLIDGNEYEAILDRVNFVKVGIKGIQLLEKPERLDTSAAIVGVIITYITQSLPKRVSVDWELFTEQIQVVPATSIDPAGPLLSQVTPDDNVHIWNNFLKTYKVPTVENIAIDPNILYVKLPLGVIVCVMLFLFALYKIKTNNKAQRSVFLSIAVLSIVFAIGLYYFPIARISIPRPSIASSTITQKEAIALVESLLKNVYRAFDFHNEEHVYDKLAITVSGDLLTEVYLQNRKSLSIQKAGGAQAKIKDVDVLTVKLEPLNRKNLSYLFTTTWTALGSVGHWGHVHTRQNQYEGIIKVEESEGNWKITGLELLDEKRIDPNADI